MNKRRIKRRFFLPGEKAFRGPSPKAIPEASYSFISWRLLAFVDAERGEQSSAR